MGELHPGLESSLPVSAGDTRLPLGGKHPKPVSQESTLNPSCCSVLGSSRQSEHLLWAGLWA